MFIQVVVMVLLHSVMPHKHQVEMTYEEHSIAHKTAADYIDYIALAFHQGTANDLENYLITKKETQQETQVLDFHSFGIPIFNINTSFITTETRSLNNQSNHRKNSFRLLPYGLRAPPKFDYYT